MIADLHTHTNASDGILRPDELVSRAKLHGVELLAITDHDTVAGLAEAKAAAEQEKLQLVTGVELSCQWQARGIHIVGLNLNVDCEQLQARLVAQAEVREARALIIAERLAKEGFANTYEGAKALAGNAEIGRPHFAKYMVDMGYVGSVEQAFKRYLGAGKIGDVKQSWPEVVDAVAWINEAGGRAVIAHPDKYKLTRTKLRELLTDFKAAGGSAVEVISGLQTPNITRDMADLCRRFKLLASCGSDFHQPNLGWQNLGGFGQLPEGLTPVWHDWALH
ncbi:MAG: PHP domain-containing protein [Marinagarivorans sp.]|nr:PHP domain-containing protein [Marinagarivorans sp.]